MKRQGRISRALRVAGVDGGFSGDALLLFTHVQASKSSMSIWRRRWEEQNIARHAYERRIARSSQYRSGVALGELCRLPLSGQGPVAWRCDRAPVRSPSNGRLHKT